ncbi:MAG: hypothetical protein HY881_10880 [Deltaproteobacteria bacterium]|nr:hypothetical protein [Deltaproteobacteria bacterium]
MDSSEARRDANIWEMPFWRKDRSLSDWISNGKINTRDVPNAAPKDVSDKKRIKIRATPENDLISRKLIQLPFMVETILLYGLFEAVNILFRMRHNPMIPSDTG